MSERKYTDEEIAVLTTAVDNSTKEFLKLHKEEVELLNIALDAMSGVANSYKMRYEKARDEAIKEFAERFKETSNRIVALRDGVELYETKLYQIRATSFDDLVAEMTEDE